MFEVEAAEHAVAVLMNPPVSPDVASSMTLRACRATRVPAAESAGFQPESQRINNLMVSSNSSPFTGFTIHSETPAALASTRRACWNSVVRKRIGTKRSA